MKDKLGTSSLSELKKIFYFVQRDFKILFTYRVAFVSMFSGIFFSLLNLVLFGAMFGVTDVSSLSFYGGDYISYVIIGSIGWGFMWAISGATSNALRSEMNMGTLEAIMATPTRVTTLMLSYSIFGSVFGFLSVILISVVGIFLFGPAILGSISLSTVVIFLLMIVMMGGLGMIFGGLTVWTKNVGQLVGFFQNIFMFFSGSYFPLIVLPAVIRPLAYYLPFYYSIEGLRRSLMPGTPDVWNYALILLVFTIILVIVGYVILRYGIKKSKMDGSRGDWRGQGWIAQINTSVCDRREDRAWV